MIRYCSLLLLVLSLSSYPICAQRVFATVDPSTDGEVLKFDINDLPIRATGSTATALIPDLNFSPNIVFTADSLRAFVSYTASNKVLVFDAKTGQILRVLDVDKNPGLITITPDGSKVAFVSLFVADNLPSGSSDGSQIGSISIIDVESLEVSTLALEDVFFSFANNIVFSEDSKTGFVASSRTDEILRFDVQTATEITPRLDFGLSVRPSSITMAPDFSFFGVVLVGSDYLPTNEYPDSIQIIDPNSFEVIRSIVPETEIAIIPHDFYASNTLAISSDGTFGLIGDRDYSSNVMRSDAIVGTLPELTLDHAILLNLKTGETLAVFQVGGVTGVSVPVPNQNRFVIFSALSLSVIDVASLEAEEVEIGIMNFETTTRPAFSQDGGTMFVTSAKEDALLKWDMENLELRQPIDLGPSIEVEIDDVQLTLPSAPTDMVLSPDQEVFAVLNFNANNILLLKDTQQFFIPRLHSTPVWFTGVALTNNSSKKAEITLNGVHRTGNDLTDDKLTEDIVEFVNPKTIALEPGQQLARTADAFLVSGPGVEIDGWLDLDSEQTQLSSFFLIGDRDVKRMDGGLAESTTSLRSILPEVRTEDGFETEIVIANPYQNLTKAKIVLFDGTGEVVAEEERDLFGRMMFSATLKVLFDEVNFEDVQNGYIEVTSERGLLVFERYYDDQRMAALNAISVKASLEQGQLGLDPTAPYASYLPQVATSPEYQSFINLINVGDQKANVSISLFLDSVRPPIEFSGVNLEIEPGHHLRYEMAQLFNLADLINDTNAKYHRQNATTSGWVLIQSDVPGVVGHCDIQVSEKAITAIKAQDRTMDDFIFSHVAEAYGISTGLALVNPGAEDAGVTVKVHDPQGVLLAEAHFSIGALCRQIGLLREFFPQSLPDFLAGGYIRVSSDKKIVGLEIFFSRSLDFLSAVPPQSVGLDGQ